MVFLSREGVPKSCQTGLSQLWSPITLRADLGSRCSLKQSYSSRQKNFNDMSHALCSQGYQVDSRIFVVGSQTGSLIPGPSFSHNLCFRCPNEQCELILDIYVPRTFQWYKKRHKPWSFDPWNCFLKFRESTGTPFPKVEVVLGVWGFTPSYSLTFSNTPGSVWCDSQASSCLGLFLGAHPCSLFTLTPEFPLGPQPCNPFALVASPKLGLRQQLWIELFKLVHEILTQAFNFQAQISFAL